MDNRKKSVIRRVETIAGIVVGVVSLAVLGVFLGVRKGEEKPPAERVSLVKVEDDTSDILDLSLRGKESPGPVSSTAPQPKAAQVVDEPIKGPLLGESPKAESTKRQVAEGVALIEVPEQMSEEGPPGIGTPEGVAEGRTTGLREVQSSVGVSKEPYSFPVTHMVRPKDTLLELARKYYGDERKWVLIYEANSLSDRNSLVVGQKVLIPSPGKLGKGLLRASSPQKGSPGRAHRVQRGDTLLNLARHYYNDESLWRKIYEANQDLRSKNRQTLELGEVLIIP